MNKKYLLLIIIGVLVANVGFWHFIVREDKIEDKTIEYHLSTDEAGQRMLDFVNKMLEPQGITASLASVIEKSGVYSVTIEIAGQISQHYITKDGRLLFPEAVDLDEVKKELEEEKKRQVEKSECEKFQAELTPERKEKIAKCLTDKGFRVYVADWCPFCRQQKEFFGEAAKHLTSIDCYDPEYPRRNNIAKCPDLTGVPVWKDKDDNVIAGGMVQIRKLVELSGCDF